MNITDIAGILGGIAAIAGFVVGILEFRRKTDLKIFRAYTEKYNSIVTPEIHDKWNKACKSEDPKDWEGLDHVAIAFLNLVWEEIFLRKTGVLRCNIWTIWKKEIGMVLQTEFGKTMMIRHEFKFLEAEFGKLN